MEEQIAGIVNMLQKHNENFENLAATIKTLHTSLSKEIQELKNEVEVMRTRSSPTSPASSGSTEKSNIVYTQATTLPTFKGSGKHPVKFLEELEQYFRKTNIADDKKLQVVEEALIENAHNWWVIYSLTWYSYDDFKNDFINNFWSPMEQNRLKHKINTARWDSEKYSMVDHFTYYYSLAQQFNEPIPEKTLLAELISHYPYRIQSLWFIAKIETVRETLDFLTRQQTLLGNNPIKRTNNNATNNGKRPHQGNGKWSM